MADGLTTPSLTRNLRAGHTYAFRVRGTDGLGNLGTWRTGSTFRLSSIAKSSSAIRYTGAWATVSGTAFLGGKARSSTAVGAKATLTFTGHTVALLSRLGPGRGKAEIWVGATKVATIDLNAPSCSASGWCGPGRGPPRSAGL